MKKLQISFNSRKNFGSYLPLGIINDYRNKDYLSKVTSFLAIKTDLTWLIHLIPINLLHLARRMLMQSHRRCSQMEVDFP